MVLWALLLPWIHLLSMIMLLLITTSTIAVTLCEAFAILNPATGSVFSPVPVTVRMISNAKRVG